MEKNNEEANLKKNDVEQQINVPKLQNQIIAGCICTFGSFVFGTSMGWLSPSIKNLQSSDGPLSPPMTDTELGLAGSFLCLGGLLGMPLYSYVVKNKGRKAAAYSIGLPFAVGFAIKLVTTNSWILLFARLLCGFGGSGAVGLPPTYIGECVEPRVRGFLSALMTVGFGVGMLTSYITGMFFSYYTYTSILMAFPLIFMLAFWFMPETPTFRLQQGQEEEAARAIAWLRKLPLNSVEVRSELVTIARQIRGVHDASEIYIQPTREELNKEMELIHAMIRTKTLKEQHKSTSINGDTTKDLSPWALLRHSKTSCRGLIIVLFMCISQNFLGIFALSSYAEMIFKKAGVELAPQICAIVYGMVVTAGSALASALVDFAGRRKLQLVSCSMIFIGEIIYAVYFHCDSMKMLDDLPINLDWLPLTSLFICVLFYNLGPATIPFVLISEFFIVEIRDLATTICMVSLWSSGFLLLFIFPPLVQMFGLYVLFYCFSMVALSIIIITFIYLPETKGRTVLEIQELLAK